jgi:hypothetical protein
MSIVDLRHDEVKEPQGRTTGRPEAGFLTRFEVDPSSLNNLVVLILQGDDPVAFNQVNAMVLAL